MSCEDLVCARCAGPVVQGHCSTCREARAEVHHPFGLGRPQLVALLVALLSVAMLVTLQVAQ